jgi:hypothetical protein
MDYDPIPVSPRANTDSVVFASEGADGAVSMRPGSGYKVTNINLVKKDKFKTLPVQQPLDGQQEPQAAVNPLLIQGTDVPSEGSDRKFLLARSHTNPIQRRQSGARTNRLIHYRANENGEQSTMAGLDLATDPNDTGGQGNLDDMINRMYFPDAFLNFVESPNAPSGESQEAALSSDEKSLFLSLKEPPTSATSRRRDSTIAERLPVQSPSETSTPEHVPEEDANKASESKPVEQQLLFSPDASNGTADDNATSSPTHANTKPGDPTQGAMLSPSMSSTNPFRPKPLPSRKVTDPNKPIQARTPPSPSPSSPNPFPSPDASHPNNSAGNSHSSVQSLISNFNNSSPEGTNNNPAQNSPHSSNIKLVTPLSPRGSSGLNPRREALNQTTTQHCNINNPFYQAQDNNSNNNSNPISVNTSATNSYTNSPSATNPSSPTSGHTANPFLTPTHLHPNAGLALSVPTRGSNSRISVSSPKDKEALPTAKDLPSTPSVFPPTNPPKLERSLTASRADLPALPPRLDSPSMPSVFPPTNPPKLERSLTSSRGDLPALPPRLSKSATEKNLPITPQTAQDKVSTTGVSSQATTMGAIPTGANNNNSNASDSLFFLPPSHSCPTLPLHRTSSSKALPNPNPLSPGRNPFQRELTGSGGQPHTQQQATPIILTPDLSGPSDPLPSTAAVVEHVAWMPECSVSPRAAFLPSSSTSTAIGATVTSPAPSFEIPPMPTVDSIWLPGEASSASSVAKKVQLPSSLATQIHASITCVLENLRLISSVKTRDVFQTAYLKVSDAHTNLKYLLGLISSSNMDPAIVSLDSKINQIIDLSNAVLMASFDIETEEGDFASRSETNSIQNISALVNEVLALC